MISTSCKYAIRAVLLLASSASKDNKFSVKEIALQTDTPEAFIGKILQTMRKHKIISSLKGPFGGFYLEKHHLDQPLINIVNAVDGLSVFKECVLGLRQCSGNHPCPCHKDYKGIREDMSKLFTSTTIGKLAKDLKSGKAYISNVI